MTTCRPLPETPEMFMSARAIAVVMDRLVDVYVSCTFLVCKLMQLTYATSGHHDHTEYNQTVASHHVVFKGRNLEVIAINSKATTD